MVNGCGWRCRVLVEQQNVWIRHLAVSGIWWYPVVSGGIRWYPVSRVYWIVRWTERRCCASQDRGCCMCFTLCPSHSHKQNSFQKEKRMLFVEKCEFVKMQVDTPLLAPSAKKREESTEIFFCCCDFCLTSYWYPVVSGGIRRYPAVSGILFCRAAFASDLAQIKLLDNK
jgi:hypothetical protein